MITEKTLRRWRRDALNEINSRLEVSNVGHNPIKVEIEINKLVELNERIIKLTHELEDLHLRGIV